MSQREQQVRERAYFIWEGEGRIFGRAEAHWLRAEAELRASLSPAPLQVQTAAPDITLAPSPAQVLAGSLKTKPSRTRSVTATVETKVKTAAAKASADVAPKQAKSAKSVAAKPAAGKTAIGKTPLVKAEPAAKTRAPKAAARPRAEAVASVHEAYPSGEGLGARTRGGLRRSRRIESAKPAASRPEARAFPLALAARPVPERSSTLAVVGAE